jgi:hypothetical protein
VTIQHEGGFVTRYGHCCAIHSRVGQVLSLELSSSFGLKPSILSALCILVRLVLCRRTDSVVRVWVAYSKS